MHADTYKNYLRDLGHLIREQALVSKQDSVAAIGTGDEAYRSGCQMAYYSVVSLMQQQAESFGIDLCEVGLEGLNPDRDVL